MLFNEPKLLKCSRDPLLLLLSSGFSALQRAEIAEITDAIRAAAAISGFSALQRAEIAEIYRVWEGTRTWLPFQCSSTSRNC